MRKDRAGTKTTPSSWMSATKKRELAQRTYVFHIVTERAPAASRTIELLASQTFSDLHHAIQQHFALDDDHMYAFFMSGQAWDHSGIFSDKNPRISLHRGGCKTGKEFLHLIDFGDELRHRIRVESEGVTQDEVWYPRLLASVGEAPAQYPTDQWRRSVQPALAADLLPLAEELLRACEDYFDGYPATELGDEPSSELVEDWPKVVMTEESLSRSMELLTQLGTALQGRVEQFDALEEFCEGALMEWMAEVLDALGDSKRAEDALRLHDLLSPVVSPNFQGWLPERHFLLLSAGRKEEATAAIEQALIESPDSHHVLHSALEFFREVGDMERLESCARQLVAQSEGHSWFLTSAQLLQAILDERGKHAEAAQLRTEIATAERLQHEHSATRSLHAPLPANSIVAMPYIAPPKPGRNDACPCGSGKKYKKCCDGLTAGAPSTTVL